MECWLASSPWPGVILWIMLYVSDYYLTIYSARGFRETGHFHFENSFELTPIYQKDINVLKPVSKLHITLLIFYSLSILLIWWFTRQLLFFPWTYLLYLGMFLLMEVAIHFRHIRNISLVHQVRRSKGEGIEGQIFYRKWFSYRISAAELYTFSAFFLAVAVLSYSTFFLGGAIMCFALGLKHRSLAKKAKSSAQAIVPGGRS